MKTARRRGELRDGAERVGWRGIVIRSVVSIDALTAKLPRFARIHVLIQDVMTSSSQQRTQDLSRFLAVSYRRVFYFVSDG
jgi:hypothetical protein